MCNKVLQSMSNQEPTTYGSYKRLLNLRSMDMELDLEQTAALNTSEQWRESIQITDPLSPKVDMSVRNSITTVSMCDVIHKNRPQNYSCEKCWNIYLDLKTIQDYLSIISGDMLNFSNRYFSWLCAAHSNPLHQNVCVQMVEKICELSTRP